jgi:hypothetical protein
MGTALRLYTDCSSIVHGLSDESLTPASLGLAESDHVISPTQSLQDRSASDLAQALSPYAGFHFVANRRIIPM